MGKNFRPEVLSPAGDMDRLKAAVEYGADAVYIAGKQFGMRAAPGNFSVEEIEKACKICHNENIKLYVTCNTLPRNDEIPFLPDFIKECAKAGVDAFIVADLGVLSIVKKHAPDIDIHISTQAGIVNYASALAMYDLGAKRVVLARELNLEEIKGIRENTPADLEIEAFVHGAMCMSFSGRCLLSNYMTGRDANRGSCAQPCRWEYYLIEKQRDGILYEIEEDRTGSYVLNSKDMCLIKEIPKLLEAGITSLKIEGRAKSEYYVASVTSAYRRAVDFYLSHPGEDLPDFILEETEKTSHREYSRGFYFGGEPGQTTDHGGYIRNYDVVAVSEGNIEDGFVKLKQRNKFLKGDTADVLSPGKPPFEIKLYEIYNEYMQPIDSAPHAEMTVFAKVNVNIEKGSYLRVRRK